VCPCDIEPEFRFDSRLPGEGCKQVLRPVTMR